MKKYHYSILVAAIVVTAVSWFLSAHLSKCSKLASQQEEVPARGDSNLRKTQLNEQQEKEAHIEISTAGPGIIKQYVHLNGRITLNRNTTTEVRARFPGVVKNVFVNWGDPVKKGQLLATIESNESLKDYEVKAPAEGRILARNISAGSVAGGNPLFIIANLNNVWAELHVFPRDLDKIQEGQMVIIHSQEGDRTAESPIAMLLPTTDPLSQTVIAIVALSNSENVWRPGAIVRADVLIGEKKVPIMIMKTALQNFRNSTVVFTKVGNQYFMREVKLGEQDKNWVEVKQGLEVGETYVSKNSFIIKADIEKAEAEHEL
ncbi:efflux RND transporter periplasmic adaptor subunit [Legionella jordanis]|uniref:HelB protein n=1 Tax=Legionella jordanis TaxID=456 RepID=A0A0W0VAX7_9GAMM|nr:efflux RND transporter periplasmic adaptor subunit [Legionella jordanis]KTD17276.1 HelB protein [Legionella jordanis]RMW99479.1 HlyD family efflux transporter periplasmic adaptor subunit [Legionella jordanis]VEH12525.1 HelB protein [Legionella jordanis]